MTISVNTAWQTYTQAWSEENESKRKELLGECLTSSAVYCDPKATATGIHKISDYIAQFQRQVPGGYFKIVEQNEHHHQLLTLWQIINAKGELVMNGSSFGEYDSHGYLFKMTGFF